jgi:hypothetical protein
MIACGCLAAPALAGKIEPARYEGRAAIQVDGDGKVSIAVDGNADGITDTLVLFAPSAELPPGWAPIEIDGTVEVDEQGVRVSSVDGGRNLRLLVSPPADGAPLLSRTDAFLALRGIALAVHDRRGLEEPLWSRSSEGIDLVLPAGTDCGGTDLDCSSGGLGSNGCDTQCGGGGVSSPVIGIDLAARRCGVSCAAGYFSCCKCDASGPSCRCREIRSVSDCSSNPQDPIVPR